MKKVIYVLSAFSILAPALAAAQQLNNVNSLVTSIGTIIKNILPIVFALILVYFFWGLGVFVLHSSDSDKRKEGQGIMLWGIIALFVAASVWGIVRFIGDAVGVNSDVNRQAPSIGY